eukprot:290333_1
MALEQLAQAFAAEDSITRTATLVSTPKDDDALDSDDESTEDTVVVNESYVETLIKSNQQRSLDDLASPSNTKTTYGPVSASHHNIIYNRPPSRAVAAVPPKRYPSLSAQPSADFLLMVENLQSRLHQKEEALKRSAKQLRQKRNDYENVLRTNTELQDEIQKLRANAEKSDPLDDSNETKEPEKGSHVLQMSSELIEKHEQIDELNNTVAERDRTIQSLTEQMEQYREVEQWLAMQIKWDSIANNESVNEGMIKLNVKTLEEWKRAPHIAAVDHTINDDEDQKQYNIDKGSKAKEEETHEEEDESKPLLVKKESKKKAKKSGKQVKGDVDTAIERQMMHSSNAGCSRCIPSWF